VNESAAKPQVQAGGAARGRAGVSMARLQEGRHAPGKVRSNLAGGGQSEGSLRRRAPLAKRRLRDVVGADAIHVNSSKGHHMNARSSAAVLPAIPASVDAEQHAALQRFGAIVRALASLGKGRRVKVMPVPAAAELPDVPTRRINRLQRMLGRLNRRQEQGGKARQFRR
jgi:hypothetical protein